MRPATERSRHERGCDDSESHQRTQPQSCSEMGERDRRCGEERFLVIHSALTTQRCLCDPDRSTRHRRADSLAASCSDSQAATAALLLTCPHLSCRPDSLSLPMSSFSHAPLLGAGGGTAVSSGPVAQWEGARKRSRQLETQLYNKLQEFAKVQTDIMNEAAQAGSRRPQHAGRQAQIDLELGRASAASSSAASAASSSSSGLSSPLLQYESLVGELEQLLQSLAQTIDVMEKLLPDSGGGSGGGAAVAALATDGNRYLLSKSQTILRENRIEFVRTRTNIQSALARAELLSGARERRDDPNSASAQRGHTEQLLREGKSLQHSLDRTDDVIASGPHAHCWLRLRVSPFAQNLTPALLLCSSVAAKRCPHATHCRVRVPCLLVCAASFSSSTPLSLWSVSSSRASTSASNET